MPDTLAGFQKMFSDFVINGHKLPRTTHIIGACNPPGPDALFAAKKLSGAFRRRLCMIPIYDDYAYVEKKHHVTVPSSLRTSDYTDIGDYCAYDGFSSAIADNVCTIAEYQDMSEEDKTCLIAGFGKQAINFALENGFITSDTVDDAYDVESDDDDGITYKTWKKNPNDDVNEFQQTQWVQRSISNSNNYNRSKLFVGRISNKTIYKLAYGLLKSKFHAEYLADDMKLPAEK